MNLSAGTIGTGLAGTVGGFIRAIGSAGRADQEAACVGASVARAPASPRPSRAGWAGASVAVVSLLAEDDRRRRPP